MMVERPETVPYRLRNRTGLVAKVRLVGYPDSTVTLGSGLSTGWALNPLLSSVADDLEVRCARAA